MEDLVYLGNFIKLQRERRDWSISKLASECNYSRSYMSQLESGRITYTDKVETIIDTIFTCMDMNYQEYKDTGVELQDNIDRLFKYIFFVSYEKREELYHKLNEAENSFKSYKVFPRYCLCKYAYNVTVKKIMDEEVERLGKTLYDNIDIFELKDKAIFYTFLGVYYRKKAKHKESENYLNKALEHGEFTDISGITFYQLACTQALSNRLFAAYINIQKANVKFKSEENHKRLIYSQGQEAVILGRSKEYEKTEKLLREILENYQLRDTFRGNLLANLAQMNYCMKNYEEVLNILGDFEEFGDNDIFMILSAYYQLSNKKDFNDFYLKNRDKVTTTLFNQMIQILYMKMNDENMNNDYVNLLLECLSSKDIKYDSDLELLVIEDLIEFYESSREYKKANKYLKMKVDILSV